MIAREVVKYSAAYVLVILAVYMMSNIATVLAASEEQLIQQADRYSEDKPAKLQRFYHTLYMEGEWNSVLNFNLLGLAAMELGEFVIAREAFNRAAQRILAVYTGDPNAKKARSLWSKESIKSFKGEPYERAMTFYYAGVLFLEQGDFQNARASFLQAEFQNSLAFSESYDPDFTLARYLAAWASFCDGDYDIADDLLTKTKAGVGTFFETYRDDFPISLTLAEVGLAPDKVTLGKKKNLLGFQLHKNVTGNSRFDYARTLESARKTDIAASLDYMAVTRGGRPIDAILEGKAKFKTNTENLAKAGTAASISIFSTLALLGESSTENAELLGNLGIASALLGGVSTGLSRATKSSADTRMWASLPKHIIVDALYSTRAHPENLVTQGGDRKRAPSITASHGDCHFTWIREYSGLDRNDGGIGNPSPWPAQSREKKRTKINKAFRAQLIDDFP